MPELRADITFRAKFLALFLAFGTAMTSLGISAEAVLDQNEETFFDALRNENAIGEFKELLNGQLQIVIQNQGTISTEELDLIEERVDFAGWMIERAAIDCGLKRLKNPGTPADRYLLFVPISQAIEEDILGQFEEFEYLTDEEYAKLSEFNTIILKEIEENGHARLVIRLNSPSSNQIVIAAFLDWNRVSVENRLAVVDYIVASSIASLPFTRLREEEAGFSFFAAHGVIEAFAGRNEDRFAKYCHFLPTVKAICDGSLDPANFTQEELDQVIERANSLCAVDDASLKPIEDLEELYFETMGR